MNAYIPKDQLETGCAYLVEARNFTYALWDGAQFVGIRCKFGKYFADTELHWDDGDPHGTVKPLERLMGGDRP